MKKGMTEKVLKWIFFLYNKVMVYIVCALYAESKSLIQRFHLKRKETVKGVEVFENEDTSLVLCLTGTGKLAAASAVSAVLEHYDAGEEDSLIQFGSAGSTLKKGIYMIHEIKDTCRSYYPDMLYDFGMKECSCKCVEEVQRNIQDSSTVYDMESAGVYVAANRRLGPHQMVFLKFVSDSGEKISASYLTRQASLYTDTIVEIVNFLQSCEKQTFVLNDEEKEQVETFAEKLHCTKAMKDRMYQLVQYAKVAGIPFAEKMEGYEEVNSKEEGKKALEAYERSIVE